MKSQCPTILENVACFVLAFVLPSIISSSPADLSQQLCVSQDRTHFEVRCCPLLYGSNFLFIILQVDECLVLPKHGPDNVTTLWHSFIAESLNSPTSKRLRPQIPANYPLTLFPARIIATHFRFVMSMFQLLLGCLITSTGDLYRDDGGCSSAIPLVPQGALDLHKIVCAANN